MKKFFAILMICALCLSLVACGSKGGSTAPDVDFAKTIAESRDAEFNKYYDIFTINADGSYTAAEGYSADYDEAYTKDMMGMLMEIMGLEASQVDKMSISLSMMMTQSYCIAIADPSEGNDAAVEQAFNNFVASQISAQEHYLPDQYEIAKSAQVVKTGSGLYVLVMSENGQTVLDNILKVTGK